MHLSKCIKFLFTVLFSGNSHYVVVSSVSVAGCSKFGVMCRVDVARTAFMLSKKGRNCVKIDQIPEMQLTSANFLSVGTTLHIQIQCLKRHS